MGKNYSDNWHSIKNTKDFIMKQMFNISEKMISEQSDEIYEVKFDITEKLITEQSDQIFGMSTFKWEHSSWKYLSLIGDEGVISLHRTKVYVFSDSVLCL